MNAPNGEGDGFEPVRPGHDYFAELYVAGVLARRGWNIYFPHRDEGFDFIIARRIGNRMIVKPIQVKGKYPLPAKTNKARYGYVGKLTQTHPEMVLVISYFRISEENTPPEFIAYVPIKHIKKHKLGYRCEPAKFHNGGPMPRKGCQRFFDEQGLELLELDQ